ncbi:Stk1 family PASTA domain-containing Ser/Thr kinase [Herbiconiux sp.]|uniref:Stk1 family PASTA domain-containing Ser/Thr kinase n=1 Tax=Herbiconiux sp. TaxID=1871186 RepID=UPI0025C36763|nr:Stk1 family PASTA domain-containing Ser/Thr kinase [Herbiconiux sp.]
MIGRLIDGRYQVRSRVARGGMATVYLATDLRLERQVAIKIMHGHLADDAAFKERFVQEARSAARLAHPNVVNVFDQGQDAEIAYLVMEYLPGVTLRDLLKDYGKLTTEQTVDVMDAVLGGLAAAHKAGIVHRDLKPENVLLADDGRIKISDFGLARAVSANTATGQALLGTIAYLSPELLTRGTADARSDIYAAGIMLYEMLVGAQPYVGEQPMAIAFQHANDQMPTPSHANPEVPEQLDDLVLWATAKDPDERPTDAREMLERLRTAEHELVGKRAKNPATSRTVVLPADSFDADLDHAQTQVLEERRRTGSMSAVNQGSPTPSTTVYGSAAGLPPAPPGARGPVGAVGPSAPGPHGSAAATQAKLAQKASTRRKRGFWILGIVVVIAALLGGTGWYFGAGPGAMTSVPDVAAMAPDDAVATLAALDLEASKVDTANLDVPAGSVIGTDPPAGSSVRNGSAISVLVSIGPAMLPVPAIAGLDEAAAQAAVTDAGFTMGTITRYFSDEAEAGIVLVAAGADGTALGAEYGERQPVNLDVSLGSVPGVIGQTLDEAKATLAAVGLVGVDGSQDFNDEYPEGQVYDAVLPEGPIVEGDSVTLNVSRGPEPVTVPSDLNGKLWSEVKPVLVDLGFSLQYNAVADAFPDTFRVSATDPEAGASVPRGSSITISFSVF